MIGHIISTIIKNYLIVDVSLRTMQLYIKTSQQLLYTNNLIAQKNTHFYIILEIFLSLHVIVLMIWITISHDMLIVLLPLQRPLNP